jgi:hypothetical protein
MRVRAEDSNGDYTFGRGSGNFLVDTPAVVGQLVANELGLMEGEWFLDKTAGTPWWQKIIGYGGNYDTALRGVILGVNGVTGLTNYSSTLSPDSRALTVVGNLQTVFGPFPLTATLPVV